MDSAARRRSRPTTVGSMLDEVFERIGIRERVEKAKTAARWEEIVGPHIDGVTKIGRVRGSTLFIEVAGAAWMTELTMMRRTLLRRLNEGRDHGRIERIMFVQAENAGVAAPSRRERYTRGRG